MPSFQTGLVDNYLSRPTGAPIFRAPVWPKVPGCGCTEPTQWAQRKMAGSHRSPVCFACCRSSPHAYQYPPRQANLQLGGNWGRRVALRWQPHQYIFSQGVPKKKRSEDMASSICSEAWALLLFHEYGFTGGDGSSVCGRARFLLAKGEAIRAMGSREVSDFCET